jgi:hypothetical protein
LIQTIQSKIGFYVENIDMFDVIFTWLKDNYPLAFGGCVLAFTVWVIARFYFNTKNALSKFPHFEVLLNKLDKGFTTLNSILLEKSVISNSCYSEGHSPRTLNEKGKKLYRESGAEALFEKMKTTWVQELMAKKCDSLLALEGQALQLLLEKKAESTYKELQDFAYQHPTFENTPLTYTDIIFVLSLQLRDEYLKIHPELNVGSS